MKQSDSVSLNLNLLTSVKIWMMLAVVLCHALAPFTGGNWGGIHTPRTNLFFGYISQWLGTFHVQTFTFCSGYLFYYLRYEQNRYRSGWPDIVKRAKRLLVPYVFISLCWAIPILLFYQGNIRVINGFLLGTSSAQLWFLLMLFDLFVFFYFISDYLVNRSLWYWVAVVGCLYVLPLIIPINLFQIETACTFAVYFGFGMLVRKGYFKRLLHIPAICFVVLNIGLFYLMDSFPFFQQKYILFGAKPVLSLLGICMAVKIFTVFSLEKFPFYHVLAVSSMGIYLFHQQFLYITLRITDSWPISNTLYVLGNFLIVTLMSVLITLILLHSKWGSFCLGSTMKERTLS